MEVGAADFSAVTEVGDGWALRKALNQSSAAEVGAKVSARACSGGASDSMAAATASSSSSTVWRPVNSDGSQIVDFRWMDLAVAVHAAGALLESKK